MPRPFLFWLQLAAALGCATSALAQDGVFPAELMFVGLSGGEWSLYIGRGTRELRRVATVSQPRVPAYGAHAGLIAYISSAGELRELDLNRNSDVVLLAPSKQEGYTQPTYRPGTNELYVVTLHEGASVETDIVRWDRTHKRKVVVLRQRSAQFEPAISIDGNHLIYSSVACASECTNVVQELWRMSLSSGVVEQLTLLNAIARQPALGSSAAVTFSSNAAGHFQLWQRNAAGTTSRITQAAAVDEMPAVGARGEIYFIRRAEHGGQLMLQEPGEEARAQALPAGFEDIRDLRWGR